MCTCVNWAKKVPRSAVVKIFNFFDFSKCFAKCRKSSYFHSRTSKIQKKKNHSFGWKMCTCVNWAQKVPRSEVRKKLIFCIFSKSFWKWRKLSYFLSRKTKLQKFTHLDGKWARVNWAKKVRSERKLPNFRFFFSKMFSKMKKIIIFSL